MTKSGSSYGLFLFIPITIAKFLCDRTNDMQIFREYILGNFILKSEEKL